VESQDTTDHLYKSFKFFVIWRLRLCFHHVHPLRLPHPVSDIVARAAVRNSSISCLTSTFDSIYAARHDTSLAEIWDLAEADGVFYSSSQRFEDHKTACVAVI